MAPDDDDDPKVKQLLSPETEADLARWFNLPSFQQLADPPKIPSVDEDMQQAIVRRDKALAAIDPDLVETLRIRHEVAPETLFKFVPSIDVRVSDNVSRVDQGLVDRALALAEPRTLEPPEQLRDDMADCTAQALLRDLHRAEFDFEKTFEIVDFAAEQRIDIVAEVAAAMAPRPKLPAVGASPIAESAAIFEELRTERRRPWADYLSQLGGRRVRE